ncbi:unnamed protein product [Aureobasidium uvarum]|uniref:non-specific serine/threonine protein kinase n=1 Tax=Aureobasidium uvarum TaxID=2773716 RepID=A0A9N8KCS3_9PEZI|nr:unnamed protein product [Aureobasidium uvarum]
MPYQYPIQDLKSFDIGEATEQLELSQCSMDSFNSERAFYRSLENTGQTNIVEAAVSTLDYGIVLEYLQPLEGAWQSSSVESRSRWIKQLLRANARIEELGYIHGDLAIRNMGVDKNDNLKLFDFGSVHQHGDEASLRLVERDASRLAKCLHFLMSGKDPLANLPDLQSLRRVECALENGTFEIDILARPIEKILKLCWAKDLATIGAASSKMVFRYIEYAILQVLDTTSSYEASHRVTSDQWSEKAIGVSETQGLQAHFVLDTKRYDLTPDPRWMAEEDYSEAWRTRGVTI